MKIKIKRNFEDAGATTAKLSMRIVSQVTEARIATTTYQQAVVYPPKKQYRSKSSQASCA